ncbi:MAG TPA: tRNA dihydrouridine(20/20a) synthase DusA [Steroidobacteraceae bacterium]|nr:tRNA dihydrouridine(20/20a) synthase DusA [Steroidobacteraceae bacterium]
MTESTGKIGLSSVNQGTLLDRRVSVAPMMDWTDRHCRYFLRGFSPTALLYTEMITAAAIVRGDARRLLAFDPEEHPVALQLGGGEPRELAAAARAGEEAGYDEINLNCGCPSDRVASGAFGACLMREPARVADCVAAMRAAVAIPVTVKMRIGVVSGTHEKVRGALAGFDDSDFEALHGFVSQVRDAGCQVAIVHARKAVLGGLSPKDNREIPPLRYDVVRRLKQHFADLPVIVNGGFRTPASVLEALTWCDGVMLGREAYHHPFVLGELRRSLGGAEDFEAPSREALLERMAGYAQRQLAQGDRLSSITRHMLGLYAGEPGARDYRRLLSEGARAAGAGPDLLRRAAAIGAEKARGLADR